MRDYAKLSPTFWTGRTGQSLKRRGPEAVIVALYLVSSPHSNMLGLYYQPILYIAEETGLAVEGASKGLAHCIDCGFARYDETTKMVWVVEMAAWQIGDQLAEGDKRRKGVQKDYDALPECPQLGAFFDRYQSAFGLKNRRAAQTSEATASPFEAPSSPLEGASSAEKLSTQIEKFSYRLIGVEIEAPSKPLPPILFTYENDGDDEPVEGGGETSPFEAPSKPGAGTGAGERDKPPPPPRPAVGSDPPGFVAFWAAWPRHHRKVARDQCRRKWQSRECESMADRVLSALEAAKGSEAWRKDDGEFIPSPLVWLNQSRWEAPVCAASSADDIFAGAK